MASAPTSDAKRTGPGGIAGARLMLVAIVVEFRACASEVDDRQAK